MTDERDRRDAERWGMKAAVVSLAIWHDGNQTVGVMQEPLGKVLAAIDAGEWDYALNLVPATSRTPSLGQPEQEKK